MSREWVLNIGDEKYGVFPLIRWVVQLVLWQLFDFNATKHKWYKTSINQKDQKDHGTAFKYDKKKVFKSGIPMISVDIWWFPLVCFVLPCSSPRSPLPGVTRLQKNLKKYTEASTIDYKISEDNIIEVSGTYWNLGFVEDGGSPGDRD